MSKLSKRPLEEDSDEEYISSKRHFHDGNSTQKNQFFHSAVEGVGGEEHNTSGERHSASATTSYTDQHRYYSMNRSPLSSSSSLRDRALSEDSLSDGSCSYTRQRSTSVNTASPLASPSSNFDIMGGSGFSSNASKPMYSHSSSSQKFPDYKSEEEEESGRGGGNSTVSFSMGGQGRHPAQKEEPAHLRTQDGGGRRHNAMSVHTSESEKTSIDSNTKYSSAAQRMMVRWWSIAPGGEVGEHFSKL